MSDYGRILETSSADISELSKLTRRLTMEQTMNALSTKDLTQKEMARILVNKGLTAAEATATASKIASTAATGTATFSMNAYTTALLANTKAMIGAMLANPVTYIVGIALAVGGAVAAYKAWDVTVEEHKEKLSELKTDYENTAEELNTLSDEIKKNTTRINDLTYLQNNGTITLIEQDELDRLILTNKLLRENEILLKNEKKFAAEKFLTQNRKTFSEDFGTSVDSEFEENSPVYEMYGARIGEGELLSDKNLILSIKALYKGINDAFLEGDFETQENLQEGQDYLIGLLKERGDSILSGLSEYQQNLALVMLPDGTFEDEADQMLWDYAESWKKEIYKQIGTSGEWNTIQLDVALADQNLNAVKSEISKKLTDGSLTETDILKYSNLITALENANLILEEGETVASVYLDYLNGIAVSQAEVNTSIPDFTFDDSNRESIDAYQSNVATLSEALDKVRNNTLTDSDKIDLFQDFPMLEERVDNLGEGIQELLTEKLQPLRKELEESGASDEILALFDNMNNEAANIDLGDALSNLDSIKSTIQSVEEEIANTDKISVSTLSSISSQYPLLKDSVDDYLAGKKTEQELLADLNTQYETDLQNYREYLILKNSLDADFYDDFVAGLSTEVKNKSESYGIDLENYANYSEAKLAMDKKYAMKKERLEYANLRYERALADFNQGGDTDTAIAALNELNAAEASLKEYEELINNLDISFEGMIPNFTPNLSFDTGKGEGDKDKPDEFSEQIDWFARAVENATRKVNELDTELSNTEGFAKRLSVLKRLKEANQELIDSTQDASDEYKDIWDTEAAKLSPGVVNLITSSDSNAEAEANYTEAVKTRKSKYKGSKFAGNVDLYNRPILLDDEGYYETLKSETFSYSDFGINKKGAFNVTPILPDGTKIDDLGKYILEQLKDGKSLEDLDVFMGGGYSSIDEAVEAAIALHEEQDVIYGAEAEYLRLLKESKDLNLSIKDFDNEEQYNNYMKAIEAYDKYQDSIADNKAAVNEQQAYEDEENGILLEQTELALDLHNLANQDTMTVKERNQWLDEEKRLKGEILKYNLLLATTDEERSKYQKEYDEYIDGEEGRKYEVAKEGRSNKTDYYNSRVQDFDNRIALAEAKGGQGTEEQYLGKGIYLEKLAPIYQADYDAALAERNKYAWDTSEYKKYNDELQAAQDNINANTLAQLENNRAILKLPIKKYEDANKLLEENLTLQQKEQEKIESAIGYANMLVQDKIDSLNEDKDAVTKKYEDQIKVIQEQKDALTESNDAIQRQIDLENAKFNLEKAMRNKTTRIYRAGEGGFVYETDQSAIKDAQADLDQQEFDNTIADLDSQIDVLNKAQTSEIEVIDAEIKTWEDYAKKLNDVSDSYDRLVSKRNFLEIFGSTGETSLLQQDTSILSSFESSLNNAKLEVDTIQAKIDANNLTIQKITEEAEGYLGTTQQIQAAQTAIDQAIVDNADEILAIEARSTKTKELGGTWTAADTEIETALGLIDTAQVAGRDAEVAVLGERKTALEQFRDAAVLLYKEIAIEVGKANLAFTTLEGTLTKAQQTYKDILALANSASDVTITTTIPEVTTLHSGGIVGEGAKLPEHLMALTDANLKPNETLAKLLNGEVVLNNTQMGNLFNNLGRAYSAITPLNKRESSPVEITIGDVNVYNPENTDMIVNEIVKELPLKVVQRLHSK